MKRFTIALAFSYLFKYMELKYKIFNTPPEGFKDLALEVFHFQYNRNVLYKNFVDALGIQIDSVEQLDQLPFLPIRFFKSHIIKTTEFLEDAIFESSGTTQTLNSIHYVKEMEIYRESYTKGFERYYGKIKNYCVIGLLPSYLERKNSSLIAMVDDFIKLSGHPKSGFYLYAHEKLHQVLLELEKEGQPVLLIGVTFALLDFAEEYPMSLKHTIIMETGGMKGRRKELTRMETHDFLKQRLGVGLVHSEYGMTELLSQAYSKGNGIFEPVPWMRALVRNEDDPLEVREKGSGIINIIDLANIFSCSFIATDDVGTVQENGAFEIAGRLDNSDIRGCSLLVV